MPWFRLAKSATADLRRIGQYTKKRWGIEQARRYLGELAACSHRLAEQPDLGKSADDVRPGLCRQRQWHHVDFYRKTDYGIRIIRVSTNACFRNVTSWMTKARTQDRDSVGQRDAAANVFRWSRAKHQLAAGERKANECAAVSAPLLGTPIGTSRHEA